MSDFIYCVMTNHAVAFGVGTGFFLLTILVVTTRSIGFLLSIILMLIGLGAALVIDRPETSRYWNEYTPEALHVPVDGSSAQSTKAE
jgi:hypothetical protein